MLTELFLFAATATIFTLHKKQVAADQACEANSLKNGAFVFVKPHANTPAVQSLVRRKLQGSGITIKSEHDIDGPTIDEKKLIDQHYYAIGTCTAGLVFVCQAYYIYC